MPLCLMGEKILRKIFLKISLKMHSAFSKRFQVLEGHQSSTSGWCYRGTSLIRNSPPLGPPWGPRHGPTVGSWEEAVSYERGTYRWPSIRR